MTGTGTAIHLDTCTEALRENDPHPASNCWGSLQELQIPTRQGPDGKLPEERTGFWHLYPHNSCG